MLRNVKCVFWFYLQLLSETFLILRRIERDTIQHVYLPHVKYLLFLSAFNENYFLDIFSKNTQLSNFMEIRPERAELFHTDFKLADFKLAVLPYDIAMDGRMINEWFGKLGSGRGLV